MFKTLDCWLSAFATGFNLAISSYGFAFRYPGILLLPVLSAVVFITMCIFFVPLLIPLKNLHSTDAQIVQGAIGISALAGFVTFALLLGLMTLFLHVALTSFVNRVLDNNKVSLLDSMADAGKQLETIVLWYLVGNVVGLLLGRDRRGSLLQSVGRITWSMATFFAIPLIADGYTGVFEIIGKSATLMKNNFGKSVGGITALSLINFFIILITIFCACAPIIAIARGAYHLGGFGTFVGLLFSSTAALLALFVILFVIGLTGASRTIFKTIVYRYAQGKTIAPFTPTMINGNPKYRQSCGLDNQE